MHFVGLSVELCLSIMHGMYNTKGNIIFLSRGVGGGGPEWLMSVCNAASNRPLVHDGKIMSMEHW